MRNKRVHTRRKLILAGAALSTWYAVTAAHAGEETGGTRKVPDPATFQSGDFLWPKKPGDFVAYNTGSPPDYELERRRWHEERQTFIDRVRSNPNSSPAARQLATNLEAMDFREFLSLYQADEPLGIPREYGGGAMILYVGHVGIVSVEAGVPWVIEALWDKGVVRTRYDDWLQGREGNWVWHGRVANVLPDARAGIAAAAKQYLDKPYNFWNFDLSDASSFYCSKLCWLSVRDALGIAIDGRPDPQRDFWFSPKQLLRRKEVEKLFVPGNYTI